MMVKPRGSWGYRIPGWDGGYLEKGPEGEAEECPRQSS